MVEVVLLIGEAAAVFSGAVGLVEHHEFALVMFAFAHIRDYAGVGDDGIARA